MADNDELKQMMSDLGEQSRQQHAEAMSRMDKMGERIEANEHATKNLENATRTTFQAVDGRMKEIESRLDNVENGLSPQKRPQLPASTSEQKQDGLGEFLEGFASGFTGGIYQPKDR